MTAPSPEHLPGLVEAVAEAIHQVFVPGSDSLGDDEDRDLARAAVAAMVEHLGLTEETRQIHAPNARVGHVVVLDPGWKWGDAAIPQTRLVTPWREVQP